MTDGLSQTVDPSPQTHAFDWTPVFAGIKDALRLPGWVVASALIGVGPLAQSVGHSVGAAMASTIFVWAGPAQVLFYSGVGAGMAYPALAFAIGLSSMRFLPMTMTIMQFVRRPKQSIWTQLAIAHFVTVTVWAECLRRMPDMRQEERVPYFFGFSVTCLVLSTFSTGLGFMLAGAVPVPFAAGLLFLTPVFFTCSISAGARDLPDWMAIGLGMVLEPFALHFAGPEFDLLVTGLVGGTVAFAVKMNRRQVRP
jgi:predicted branched-subunit amino acid permease